MEYLIKEAPVKWGGGLGKTGILNPVVSNSSSRKMITTITIHSYSKN
ncbi:MAG TPA: hypothetical protein VE445_07090 [Nitrososphaeraceae archaeon]|nr:hypothetical protein [Nitrososphaeraceae archaeon]